MNVHIVLLFDSVIPETPSPCEADPEFICILGVFTHFGDAQEVCIRCKGRAIIETRSVT